MVASFPNILSARSGCNWVPGMLVKIDKGRGIAKNADWILMDSDYPHAEGVETARALADEACRGLTEAHTRKVPYESGMRFVGLRSEPAGGPGSIPRSLPRL